MRRPRGSWFIFHTVAITGGELANLAERETVGGLGRAVIEFDHAEDALNEEDVEGAGECIEGALARLAEARSLFEIASGQGTLDPDAKEELTGKAIKRSIGKATVGLAKGEKIEQGGSGSPEKVRKKVLAARDRAELAIMNVLGWKTKKSKKAAGAFQLSESE